MAIEFNCPYCTAAIRVPDKAGGKRGRCPKCATKLRVPKVSAPPKSAEPEPDLPTPPAGVEEAPDFSAVEMAAADTGDGPDFSAITGAEATAVETGNLPVPGVAPAAMPDDAPPRPSIARQLKRRRRRKRSAAVPLVILLLGGGLVAASFLLLATSEPKLEGTLNAVAMDEPDFRPGTIDTALSGLTGEQVSTVLADIEQNPLSPLHSELMTVQFVRSKRGLDVLLFAGPEARFYKVAVRENQVLREWIDENITELDKPRQNEFSAATKQFFEEKLQAVQEDAFIADLPGYRDRMGINSMLSGFGYHLEAVADGTRYRAVHEDVKGNVYFLLPPGLTKFSLRGRELANGRQLFPGRYQVRVTGTQSGGDNGGDTPDEPEPDPMEEPTPDPEGMEKKPAPDGEKPADGTMSPPE